MNGKAEKITRDPFSISNFDRITQHLEMEKMTVVYMAPQQKL